MSNSIQFLGQKVDLKMSSPADEMLDTFKSGVVQSFAEDAPLKRSSNPVGMFTNQSMGEVQDSFTGKVPLNRKAHRGYESGTTANMQSEAPDTESSY